MDIHLERGMLTGNGQEVIVNGDEYAPINGSGQIQQGIPITDDEDEDDDDLVIINNRNTSFMRGICGGIKGMPIPIRRAFVVQYWVWFAHFAVAMYLTDWFGKNIMNGSPDSSNAHEVDLYELGVKYANVGLFIDLE